MPELIAFYEDHAAERHKFEVLAIHDDQVKSFRELDKKLADVKKKYWAGKNLPCPILLDGEGITHALYGVNSWPTGVLIDPEGNVVAEASLSMLEAKLTPTSSAQRWSRHRDMQKNVFWSFEPKENTVASLATILGRWTQAPVQIDLDAIRNAGLTTSAPLPGVMMGSSITLRSIDQFLLAPHGLGVVPATNGDSLIITRPSKTRERLSYFQKQHNTELTKRLDGMMSEAAGEEQPKPLRIENETLLGALKLIAREYGLPVGIDAKAMQTGRVDADAKVTGLVDPARLRKTLLKLLEPLGLKLEVRHEVVVVVPAK